MTVEEYLGQMKGPVVENCQNESNKTKQHHKVVSTFGQLFPQNKHAKELLLNFRMYKYSILKH